MPHTMSFTHSGVICPLHGPCISQPAVESAEGRDRNVRRDTAEWRVDGERRRETQSGAGEGNVRNSLSAGPAAGQVVLVSRQPRG